MQSEETMADDLILGAFVAVTVTISYVIVHMLYNRHYGKDELDDLFALKRLLKKKK